jgi:phenylacetic acid degradation operon negative regulatory protein
MRKLLRTKDRILIALSLLGDAALYAYVKGSGWRKGNFFDFLDIRKSLRQKLRELGFGQLQKSVYISPLDVAEDVREVIQAHHLADFVFVAVARRFFGDNKDLAARVWRLDKLNEKYADFLLDLEDFLASRGGLNFHQLYNAFENILLADPCLPKELLPDWWIGDRAFGKIKELLRARRIAN